VTDLDRYDADVLVVALGADYDIAATPGLAEAGNEFYTVGGAETLRDLIPSFQTGTAIVGVCGAPFKCPPAPSETALLLHDYLSERGLRDRSEITFTIPLSTPVPPSPETSVALEAAFAERGIAFLPGRRIASLDGGEVSLDDGTKLPYDLFLGVPKHGVAAVVRESGMLGEGEAYVPVDPHTLQTRWPGVYAVGDVAQLGVPKAGVFAEGAAKVVADQLIAQARDGDSTAAYEGRGSCYIEFGAGRVGRVDVDFLSGPKPTGTYHEPSVALVTEKERFGSSRRARWFGLD
jgi:sulfide:quinone oxidoreductase